MKIKFDVTPKEFIIIKDILEKYLQDDGKAWVFGSRAKSSSLVGSDLDLAIECQDKVALKLLSQIKIAFEDSRLPYRVDVVDMKAVKPYFKELIKDEMVVFPLNHFSKVPALRFPEFSGEWDFKKLGSVCSFTQGVQIPFSEQVSEYKDGFIRYLYIRDFFTDDYPYYVLDIYPKKIIYSDEIMIVNTGNTAGKAFTGATGVLSNNAFKVGFDKKNISASYLFQRLISENIQRKIRSFFNAGGQPHLGHKNIAIVPLTFPILQEQQKIAAFLTQVDNKIEQLTKKKQLLADYKKGVMQQVFSQEIRFKQDDGSDYPDWEVKKLGDVATFFKGKGISKSDIEETGLIECIRYGELYTHYGEWIKEIKSKTNIDISELVLSKSNDVIIPASGETSLDIATASCILKNGIALGGDLNIIRTKLNGIFLSYYLNSNKKHEIASFSQGVSVVHLYSSQLKLLTLHIPTIEEQTKIANFLTEIDTKINQVEKQLAGTKQFKSGLLQQMFV